MKAENLSERCFLQVNIPIELDADLWVEALEQALLFVLIIGRWILPKGRISRDQLSLLLLLYVGTASDITDVLVVFEEPVLAGDDWVGYIILGVWSFSLLQFCLVLTITGARGSHRVVEMSSRRDSSCQCCESEIWSILTTVVMQDGPFLAVRLWVIFKYETLNYSLLFFSLKNALLIFLQLYRLFVVSCRKDPAHRKKIPSKQWNSISSYTPRTTVTPLTDRY